ncbi:DUF3558 family protein [Pseudonocardia sp. KRD291]|uniref:DUF3558 family protein n=1 Tax=Pseudonocardia sp. KRD291 TaxID=2792007 RepID=UPI001C49D8F5|nr:hypothetical protein [Pseudonocardia sp. KRD291]MBW0102106.1 hypothetical protein [Pseudonocardia sp. KRD291]
MRAAVPASVLAVALVSGCGAPAAAASPFPPRPADLEVSRLPACEAVDARSSVELGILERTPDPIGQGANNCVLHGVGGQFWLLRIQPGIPADRYVPGHPDRLGERTGFTGQRITTVEGYGAIENAAQAPPTNYTCTVVVDADPDTSFLVTYEVNSPAARSRAVGSHAEGCDRATRVAAMVIAAARARS